MNFSHFIFNFGFFFLGCWIGDKMEDKVRDKVFNNGNNAQWLTQFDSKPMLRAYVTHF